MAELHDLLYLLFSEGYHGSDPREPVRPFLCTDALRLTELMLESTPSAHPEVSALAALFCFDIARLGAYVKLDLVAFTVREWIDPMLDMHGFLPTPEWMDLEHRTLSEAVPPSRL